MEMGGIGDCKLCFETFSSNRRSRCLPCGHSFCTICLDILVKDGTLSCPNCKKAFKCATGNEFPINYDLEETITRCREDHLCGTDQILSAYSSYTKQSTASDTVFQSHVLEVSPTVQTIISNQKVSSENLLKESKDLVSEMGKYQNYLDVEKARLLELLQKVRKLANLNEAAVMMVNDELNRLTSMNNDTYEFIRRMEDRLQCLEISKSLKSAISAISSLDQSFSELNKWNKQCQQKLPDAKVVIISKKVIHEITAALSMVEYENYEELEVPDLSCTTYTISEKKDRLLNHPTLNIERLKRIAESKKGVLERDLVYAVQSEEDVVRYARISTENGELFLHHLQDEVPSQHAHTIKQSELIASLNAESSVAFLDLAWEGSTKGRVLICLSPGTPYGRQFKMLCTGDLGPSYANSKFEHIGFKGTDSEYVGGGNYDNKGGLSIIEGIEVDLPVYKQPNVAGTVWARYHLDDKQRSAQFVITTRKGNSMVEYHRVFGQVIEGLDIVIKAANVKSIKNVRIADCGVLVPL